MFHKIGKKYRETALIKLIAAGLVIGIIIALAAPQAVPAVAVLGDLFVRALKGIAPILVFVLVMNALAQKNSDASAAMKPIVRLYVFATFCASLVAWAEDDRIVGLTTPGSPANGAMMGSFVDSSIRTD